MIYVEGNFYFETDTPKTMKQNEIIVQYMGYPFTILIREWNINSPDIWNVSDMSLYTIKMNLLITIDETTMYNNLNFNNESEIKKLTQCFVMIYFRDIYDFKFIAIDNIEINIQNFNSINNYYENGKKLGFFDTDNQFDIRNKNGKTGPSSIIPETHEIKISEINEKKSKSRKITILEDEN